MNYAMQLNPHQPQEFVMSAIIVHGIPGSPYVRIPLLACEEKSVSYRLARMGFGDSKSPENLRRQPFGRIPSIEHGDFKLYEAAAIIRYIDQAFEGPALTPKEPRATARMNQVMNIVDWYVMPSISAGIAFNRVVRPRFGMPVIEAEVTAALPMARTCVSALEDIIKDQLFFAGEAISLADLMAFPQLEFFAQAPEGREMLAKSPLLAWLDRMGQRPSARNTAWAVLEKDSMAA
jgi:glutathione S-transferase